MTTGGRGVLGNGGEATPFHPHSPLSESGADHVWTDPAASA